MIWQWLAEPVMGSWSRVEVAWTALALLGLTLNSVKLWLVIGDLAAAWRLRRLAPGGHARARELAAWWVVANAAKDELMLSVFILIGWVAGQLPPQPVTVGTGSTTASVLSGLAFIAVELVTIAVVAFTLWARLKLGLPGEWGKS